MKSDPRRQGYRLSGSGGYPATQRQGRVDLVAPRASQGPSFPAPELQIGGPHHFGGALERGAPGGSGERVENPVDGEPVRGGKRDRVEQSDREENPFPLKSQRAESRFVPGGVTGGGHGAGGEDVVEGSAECLEAAKEKRISSS